MTVCFRQPAHHWRPAGISHYQAENVTAAQAAAGANVLLHAILAYDAEA